MTCRRYKMRESTLFNQLFGSTNYVTGGVGRSSVTTVLACTTEERLVEAARERGAHVLMLGSDYVVLKAPISARKVYFHT